MTLMNSHDADPPNPGDPAVPDAGPRPRRRVVSYVRRGDRMNPSQQRAWDERDAWMVEVARGEQSTSVAEGARVDWPEQFGRVAPMVVEIGSGTGDALVAGARAHPDWNFVAFEVFRPAMASTMIKLRAEGLTNARLVEADGVAALRELIEPGLLTELWTYFPDPWHKTRHAKRRLVQPEFGALVASRLGADGVWRIATDWAEYAEHCREVLDDHPDLVNVYDGPAPRTPERPLTKYEQRGIRAGREVTDLTYRKRT